MARVRKVHHTPAARYGALRRIEAHGMRLGRSGNKRWLYIGTGLWTLRTVRRMAERREEVLISERLLPGQRIIIANNRATIEGPVDSARPPKGRRAAKAQRKADKKATKQDAKIQAKAARGFAKQAKQADPVSTSGDA
jgi:hypothetical protein